ncbi:serine/threonine protein kinase [Sphaerisporangium corydalis]|uniref:non-specific serine/threonine protein kinase n=1 Tax=Sphaerisporangium corydalis TaxID=1441875 RepID=A0ABV9EDM8_9ACTN|nr:serine/threonine protein kinase [Sphaerisporangium corydalis]
MDGHTGAWQVPGYTEIRDLGSGGSGRVVMARYGADQSFVAIKYLSDELCADPGFVIRFRHEARLLELLDSPYAARFYEYIEGAGGAAIVMELVDGVSLRAMLRSEGPTGAEAALVLLKGALLGLATAHATGVVHRDFKPENVVIEGTGHSKLIDFGIAVRSGEGVSGAGTPAYMAPEQWAGAPAGPSTDVYAATIVFFECLTGTRPFQSQNIAVLARQHQSMPPPTDQVPAPLRGLIERGLAKHPADRPATAETFLSELEMVAADAYGPDWEERGRRRLASLAGILALLFPLAGEEPAAGTSVADTHLGGGRAISKLSVKIAVGAAGLAVVAAVTAVLVGSLGDATLQAQSTVTTPTATPPSGESGSPEPAITDSPTEAPSDDAPADTPSTDPAAEPTGTTAAVPTGVPDPPTSKTPKPSARPSRSARSTLSAKPTPSASERDDSEPKIDDTRPGSPKPKPKPKPTPTPTPTPTATRTRPTPTPSTESPTPTGGEGGDGGTIGVSPTDRSETPAPSDSAPSAALASVLMTAGAVPATLVLRERLAGRHRRRR